MRVDGKNTDFGYGTLIISAIQEKISKDELYKIIVNAQDTFSVKIYSIETGYSTTGIDLGSGYVNVLKSPKAFMLIGEGVNSYEAGEVWHLLDTRVHMPITKIPIQNFNRASIDEYNTLVMVSGNYNSLDSTQQKRIKEWTSKGNTIISLGSASKWLIDKKLVKEQLTIKKKDSLEKNLRSPYVNANEILGRESVGGAIFNIDIDITHPLAFGYSYGTIPIYKNNTVWIAPSKNQFSTVGKYTQNPHVDGFITNKNLEEFLKPSAALIVSPIGRGRVVLFDHNPNFRGSWYGTNRLFLNALFLGQEINIPN